MEWRFTLSVGFAGLPRFFGAGASDDMVFPYLLAFSSTPFDIGKACAQALPGLYSLIDRQEKKPTGSDFGGFLRLAGEGTMDQSMQIERPKVIVTPTNRVSRKDAATALGLQPKTLAQWASLGKGPKMHKIGGRAFYAWSDILAFSGEEAQ